VLPEITVSNEEAEALFAATLAESYDDDEPWKAVSELRANGNQYIFENAVSWCRSTEPLKRARGADILCQLRAPKTPEQEQTRKAADPIFVPESFEILTRMIEQETDEQALSSELFGLGHLGHVGSIPFLVPYSAHSSEDIRYAVACALGSFTENPDAIRTLSQLADDPDDDVRDWSLFALGTQSNADSPELRELFVRHLDDPHLNAREEALAGLAKRQDTRAALPLLRLMESGSYSAHHTYDFVALVGENLDLDDWGTEDFIDALYARFTDLLPPRK
jgi:HEAT repeat protein